ncbi:MAG: hypothetical protein MUC55_02645 [Burkholderiales bacterium]|jgi:hypothetical protein|nr:hypothetical protein [Burkholderiales bacterium]
MRDLACASCRGGEGTAHAGAPGWVATIAMGTAMLFAPDSVCRSGDAALPALVAHAAVMLAAIPVAGASPVQRALGRIGPERRATLAWTFAIVALCLAAITMAPAGPRLRGETLGLHAALLAAWFGAIVVSVRSPAPGASAQTRGSIPAMGAAHAPCFAALAVAVGAILI